MNESEPFPDSVYIDRACIAGRELSAFVKAVTQLFGPEQARVAAEDWLAKSELIGAQPRSTTRDWRSVTIAASARLATRIDAAEHRRKSLAA